MKGYVLKKIGETGLMDVDAPEIVSDSDALIKITLTTICGSDLHLKHGMIPSEPPYTLGHEYTAVVSKVGKDVASVKPGDRVIGPAAPFCGQCPNCLKGNIAQCQRGGIHGAGPTMGGLPGTHAEYIRVPFADVNLIKIPDTLKDEEVLFVGDILSTGLFAVENGGVKPGDAVVVFGAGPVGLCSVAAAQLYNPSKTILIDIDPFRLEKGVEQGATHTINPEKDDVLGGIAQLTDGLGADVAIDAVGLEVTLQQSCRCVGIGGTVSVVGIGGNAQIPFAEIFMKNISIVMGLGYLGKMKTLIKMIESKKINMLPLITHKMPFSDIEKAFKIFENHEENVIKIALTL